MKPKLHVPTEHQEQVMLCQWLDAHRILYCAVPNGGSRHMLEAKKMKRAGVKAGVPDILIFSESETWPTKYGIEKRNHPRGVAIELKRRGKSRATLLQHAWLQSLAKCMWLGRICYGADEAIEWLRELGFGQPGAMG